MSDIPSPAALVCPRCGSRGRQIKDGKNRSGSQRYQCQECKKVYTPAPAHRGHSDQTRLQAVKLYLEGNNLRRIARLLSCSPQSVSNWIDGYHAQLPPAPDRSLDAAAVVELDELFTFVGDKKTGSLSPPP